MDMLNVQFADETEKVVVSFFASPQDPAVFAHQGQIVAADARWLAYYNSLPDLVQHFLPAPETPSA